jgi:hypothetical protein
MESMQVTLEPLVREVLFGPARWTPRRVPCGINPVCGSVPRRSWPSVKSAANLWQKNRGPADIAVGHSHRDIDFARTRGELRSDVSHSEDSVSDTGAWRQLRAPIRFDGVSA